MLDKIHKGNESCINFFLSYYFSLSIVFAILTLFKILYVFQYLDQLILVKSYLCKIKKLSKRVLKAVSN